MRLALSQKQLSRVRPGEKAVLRIVVPPVEASTIVNQLLVPDGVRVCVGKENRLYCLPRHPSPTFYDARDVPRLYSGSRLDSLESFVYPIDDNSDRVYAYSVSGGSGTQNIFGVMTSEKTSPVERVRSYPIHVTRLFLINEEFLTLLLDAEKSGEQPPYRNSAWQWPGRLQGPTEI